MEVLQELADIGVDYMKGGPSTTSQHQPLDVCTIFRDTKAYVRKDIDRRPKIKNNTLEANLRAFFNNLRDHFAARVSRLSTSSSSNTTDATFEITASYKDLLIFGVIRLCDVLRNQAVTADKMRQGFSICGQHVESESNDEQQLNTVSYERIMRQINKDCENDAERQIILADLRDKFGQVVEYAQQHGHVSNAFLDEIDVARTPDFVDRDDLVLHRQDAQIITHADSIARIREYKLKRSPEHIAEQAAIKNASKLIFRMGKEKARKEEIEAKKIAELERKRALSKRERDDEAVAKRAENSLKKQRIQAEKSRKEQEAMQLLGEGETTVQLMKGAMAQSATTREDNNEDANDGENDDDTNQNI